MEQKTEHALKQIRDMLERENEAENDLQVARDDTNDAILLAYRNGVSFQALEDAGVGLNANALRNRKNRRMQK